MKNRFIVNFLSLNISSFINKLLNFFLFIFLIRFLSVEDYGMYNFTWAYIGLFAPFIDFGTTTYGLIHLPQEKKEHFLHVTSLRTALALIIFFLTILNAIILRYSQEVISYVVLLSVVILANMWSGSYLMLTSVKGKNYLASIISIVFNTFLISTLIYTLFVRPQIYVLFIIISVFYAVYGFINYLLVQREFGRFSLSININEWKSIIRKSYIFVLISFFAGLYFKLDVLLLEYFKSSLEVGIYSAGYKFFEAFIFIASAYNFAGAPVLAHLFNSNKKLFKQRVVRDALLFGLIGLCGVIGTYIFAPLLLPLLLKGDYAASLDVLKVVIFALPCLFVTTIFLNGLYIIKKSHYVVYVFIFLTILNLVLNILFIPNYSYTASAWITVISEVLNMLFVIYLFFKNVEKN